MEPVITDGSRASSYQFGPFVQNAADQILHRFGELVPLTPKTFDTLLVLVESGGRVISRAELLERVWPNAFVEESNITQNIFVLRKTLDPYFEGESPIATVPRRGYRFTTAVQLRDSAGLPGEAEVVPVSAPPAAAPLPVPRRVMRYRWIPMTSLMVIGSAAAAFWLAPGGPHNPRTRPSVAVIEFRNLSQKSEFDWLSAALAETLTAELGAGEEFAHHFRRARSRDAPGAGFAARPALDALGTCG